MLMRVSIGIHKDDIDSAIETYNLMSQKFFEDYITINGLQFPKKVTQIFYKDGKESYEIDKYDNIILNEQGNDEMYNYTPPAE